MPSDNNPERTVLNSLTLQPPDLNPNGPFYNIVRTVDWGQTLPYNNGMSPYPFPPDPSKNEEYGYWQGVVVPLIIEGQRYNSGGLTLFYTPEGMFRSARWYYYATLQNEAHQKLLLDYVLTRMGGAALSEADFAYLRRRYPARIIDTYLR